MPKRSKIVIAMALAVLVWLIGWQVAGPREPLYRGKPVSYFLKYEYIKANDDTAEAVRSIGTNGIPALLRLLCVKTSPFQARLMDLARRQNIIKVEYTTPELGYDAVAYAFGILGTNAHTAVPALIKIADDNISPRSRARAIESLGYVGLPTGDAVPALRRWATNSDANSQALARFGLKLIDPEGAAKGGFANAP